MRGEEGGGDSRGGWFGEAEPARLTVSVGAACEVDVRAVVSALLHVLDPRDGRVVARLDEADRDVALVQPEHAPERRVRGLAVVELVGE